MRASCPHAVLHNKVFGRARYFGVTCVWFSRGALHRKPGLEGQIGTGLEYLTGLRCDARAHLYMDIQGLCGLDKGITLCSQETRSAEGVICESEVYHF